jgi:hypothetical protein
MMRQARYAGYTERTAAARKNRPLAFRLVFRRALPAFSPATFSTLRRRTSIRLLATGTVFCQNIKAEAGSFRLN